MESLVVIDDSELALPTAGPLLVRALGPSGLGAVAVRLSSERLSTYADLRLGVLTAARRVAMLPAAQREAALRPERFGTDASAGGVATTITDTLRWSDVQCASLPAPLPVAPPPLPGGAGGVCRSDVAALGAVLLDIAARVADACSEALACGVAFGELVREAGTAKVRLIHYHSHASSDAASAPASDTAVAAGRGHTASTASRRRHCRIAVADPPALWSAWHQDYGLFTALTAPLYAVDEEPDQRRPAADSSSLCGAAPCGGLPAGLILATPAAATVAITPPPGCIIVQVGEAATILSGGLLRAAPHAVGRPCGAEGCASCAGREDGWPTGAAPLAVSRTTYALFLQPAWGLALNTPRGGWLGPELCYGGGGVHSLPPLEERWRDGDTFADFGRATTASYYGRRRRQC